MCESSEGSSETAQMLMCVWALTDEIYRMYALSVHVWEQWRVWRDCTHAKMSEHWLIKYAKNTPILCMYESSEGSGKTACILGLVWALTEKNCHMYAHFVHVREEWRLWQDCTHAKARLSNNWKNMPYVRPFCACVRAVKALVRLHAC